MRKNNCISVNILSVFLLLSYSLVFLHCVLFVFFECKTIADKNTGCRNIMCLGDCIWRNDALRCDILETHYTIDFPDNCDYVDYDSAIKLENTDLSFVQLNIRGMYNKLPELIHLTDRLTDSRPLDVLMLCETWLTKHTPSFSVPGYNIIRNDRLGKRGGGVSVLVSKRLKTKDRPELTISSPELECCGIEIITKTNPIIVISAYRLPILIRLNS